jgi:hypothetical protein
LHTRPHVPAAHVADALVPLGHALPHIPQCPAADNRFTSQPLSALPSQSPKPAAQVIRQRPAAQPAAPLGPAGHTFPHAPQWLALVPVFTSQPFVASPSQSAKPAAQVIRHTPITHEGAALGPAAQAFPQRPQSVASDCKSTQVIPHRVCAIPQPDTQRDTPPIVEHSGVAPAHTFPHAPQLAVPSREASQPFALFPSQSAKPARQRRVHADITHAGAALGAPGHTVPHEPQRIGSSVTLKQLPPQHACPIGHALRSLHPATHAPAAHTCPAGQSASAPQPS